MLRTFNLGIGMVLIVRMNDLKRVTKALEARREKYWMLGRVVRGRPGVEYV
jgi:phosphoribosylformylglycinamidine cyclo-ligase